MTRADGRLDGMALTNQHIAAVLDDTARLLELQQVNPFRVYETDHEQGQCTIMTAGSGDLKGARVVRGREDECREYYRRSAP